MGGHTILQRCQGYQGPFISRSDINIYTKKYPQKIPHLLSLHQSKISVNEPPLPPPLQTGKRETHLGIGTVDTTRSFGRVTAHETVLIEQQLFSFTRRRNGYQLPVFSSHDTSQSGMNTHNIASSLEDCMGSGET